MSPGNDQRPDHKAEALGDRWATDDSQPILRLTATVLVDLDHDCPDDLGVCDLDRADRRALEALHHVPSGARIRVNLGNRYLLTHSAVHMLHRAAQRLDVELIVTDSRAAWRWHGAVTAGSIE